MNKYEVFPDTCQKSSSLLQGPLKHIADAFRTIETLGRSVGYLGMHSTTASALSEEMGWDFVTEGNLWGAKVLISSEIRIGEVYLSSDDVTELRRVRLDIDKNKDKELKALL